MDKHDRVFHAINGLYEMSLHGSTAHGGLTLLTGASFGMGNIHGFHLTRANAERLADALQSWLVEQDIVGPHEGS